MSSINYRIFCNTENKWVTTTGVPALLCPTDATHSVKANTLQDLSQLVNIDSTTVITVYPYIYQLLKSANFTAVARLVYFGTSTTGIIKIEILGYTDTGATNFDVKIVDLGTNLTIAQKTGISITIPTIIDMGTISNVPSSKTILEVQLKNNSINILKYAYLNNILLYCA